MKTEKVEKIRTPRTGARFEELMEIRQINLYGTSAVAENKKAG